MSEPSLIIYDGECIFCQNYVRFVRLRETIGKVELIDARSGHPAVAGFWREGYDLNEGMLFVHRGRTWHGADAVHVLASLSSERGAFNRLNAWLFASPAIARLLYPLLKLGRRLTLAVRGRGLIPTPPEPRPADTADSGDARAHRGGVAQQPLPRDTVAAANAATVPAARWKSLLLTANALLVIAACFVVLFNLPVVTGDVPQ